MLEFVLKEPRPSIMCINEHTLKNFFCFANPLFLIDPRKYYNTFILEILIFDFHELYTLIIKVKNMIIYKYMKVSLSEISYKK